MTSKYELQAGKIQESLLNKKIKDSVAQVVIYIDINGELFSVNVNSEGLNTTAAILEAV